MMGRTVTARAGRQAQKDGTRVRILEAARLHFERHGFEGASVRGIAAEAEVAAGTVLLHFSDKLSLLHAALHDDLESALRRSLRTPSPGLLLRRLCSVVRPFYAYYEARPRLSRVLLRESLLAASPWRERFTEQLTRVNRHVSSLVAEAKATGELSASCDGSVFTLAFASFYYFALIGWVQGAVAGPLPLFQKLMAQHIASASARERQA